MAKKKASGSLASQVKGAVAATKGEETSYGRRDLPGNIPDGIAQVSDVKFDKFKTGANQGSYYCRIEGIVHTPEENGDGIPVKGLQTSKMFPLCDTKNQKGEETSIEENVGRCLNEFRKLGLETDEYDDADIEQMGEDLKDAAPFFRFSTEQSAPSKQFPNPRVWENWHGAKGLDDYVPDEGDDPDEDEDEEDEEQPVAKPTKKAAPKKKVTKKKPTKKAPAKHEPTLADLAELADNDDEDAQAKITDAADSAGVEINEEYEDWAAVVAAIEGGSGEPEYEDAVEDEEEAEEIVPEKGEFYTYDGAECEVIRVVKTKKKCDLKNAETEEVTKGVDWSDLETE